MREALDFLQAAMPWIVMGLTLAVFFVGSHYKDKKKKESKEKYDDYGSAGIGIGMCFGVAIEIALYKNTGMGAALGMLIGYAVGSSIKRPVSEEDTETEIQE